MSVRRPSSSESNALGVCLRATDPSKLFYLLSAIVVLMAWLITSFDEAHAQTPAQKQYTKRMYERLTGTPPNEAELNQYALLVSQGRLEEAARLATQSAAFINVKIKRMALEMTNRTGASVVPFNDSAALFIGLVKDGKPFDRILYGDDYYIGSPALGMPSYTTGITSTGGSSHFNWFNGKTVDLRSALLWVPQGSVRKMLKPDGTPATAGIRTTDKWAQDFFRAGTNRRSPRFVFKYFMCSDLEEMMDNTRSEEFVRRDVNRSPGGNSSDSVIFKTNCLGCHGGLDPISGAWVHYEYKETRIPNSQSLIGRFHFEPTVIQDKVVRNGHVFPAGHQPVDDSWINLWAQGPNASFGFRGNQSGRGPQSLGFMLARSRGFATCMAKKAFKSVCMREASSTEEKEAIETLANKFEEDANYNLANLFAATAVNEACMN